MPARPPHRPAASIGLVEPGREHHASTAAEGVGTAAKAPAFRPLITALPLKAEVRPAQHQIAGPRDA